MAKAVGMYGARFREPIRVSYEPEAQPTPPSAEILKYEQQPQLEKVNFHPEHLSQKYHEDFLSQNAKDEQRITEEQKQINNEYYTYYQKDVRHHAYAPEKEPTQTQQFYKFAATRPTVEHEQKTNVEEQAQKQEQEYRQKERPQSEQVGGQKAQTYEKQNGKEYDEKEPMTRSYQIYEEQTESQEAPQQHFADEQKYRTKYVYKEVPQYQEKKVENVQENEAVQDTTNETENEERVRVSAATEIPKAEIMKQIEKSVIKYMKELEAEGKIVTTTQNVEPEPYFKVETITPASVKHKIKKPIAKYSTPSSERTQEAAAVPVASKKYSKNSRPQEEEEERQEQAQEVENLYQPAGPPQVDAVLTPNVEFIYKIKTQAPLHTATVKTVSKPYNLALKSFEQFDHSKALKNLQEFDLTHVVTTPDPEEPHQNSQHNKLYFNSEIYHDLKTKSIKQKPKKETEYQPEYENYAASKSQGGYYAEPPADREAASSSNVSEDGYPLMNPYRFVSKKEALPKRQEDSYAAYDTQQQQQQQQTKKLNYNPLEYDSYNPKFNNNPEGYGYQQTYKSQLSTRHSPGKRGKRGGGSSGGHKKSSQRAAFTDLEANAALRPPPKQ